MFHPLSNSITLNRKRSRRPRTGALLLALSVAGLTGWSAANAIAEDAPTTQPAETTAPAQAEAEATDERPAERDRHRDRFMRRGQEGQGQPGMHEGGRDRARQFRQRVREHLEANPELQERFREDPEFRRELIQELRSDQPGPRGRRGPGAMPRPLEGEAGMQERKGPHGQRAERGERGGERPEGRRGEGRGGPDAMGDRPQRGPGAQRDRSMRELFRDVNLTDEQREQVGAIVREAAQPMQQFMAENAMALREAREQIQTAAQARDREAIGAARENLSAIMETAPRPDRDTIHAQVREVLTEQQQQVFDANLTQVQERRAQREQRREEMRQRRMQRGDGEEGERAERRRGDRQRDGDREQPAESDGESNEADGQLDL